MKVTNILIEVLNQEGEESTKKILAAIASATKEHDLTYRITFSTPMNDLSEFSAAMGANEEPINKVDDTQLKEELLDEV